MTVQGRGVAKSESKRASVKEGASWQRCQPPAHMCCSERAASACIIWLASCPIMLHHLGLGSHGRPAGQPFDQAMAGKGRSFDASKPASQNQAQGKPMGSASFTPQQFAFRIPAGGRLRQRANAAATAAATKKARQRRQLWPIDGQTDG